MPRAMLTVMMEMANRLARGISMRKVRRSIESKVAKIKLDAGPARAMRAPSRLGFSRL